MDDCLEIDFSMYEIRDGYYRKNKKCIFDIIREIFILETPEEIIRQKFVRYLIEDLKVPKSKIELEVPMSHFKKGARGRADIVVYGENTDGINIPIMIIECKAPNIPLIDEVWFQAYRYDDILGAGFIVITNGDKTYGAIWDKVNEEYYFIEEIPKYTELVKKEGFKVIYGENKQWKRPNFSELLSESTIDEFIDLGWIGEDTDKSLYPLIINLAGFLQDENIEMIHNNIDELNIIEDGWRYTSYGNAAGGTWAGDYRYFILKDNKRNNQIVSISIFGSLKCKNHPTFGNRRGNTVLVVAIDDFDRRHNSLQLNIDKYTIVNKNKYTIWHDGTITIGRMGAGKKKELIEYIKSKEPSIVDFEGNIILGCFNCREEINWHQENTQCFIKNIIKYAILRDEYRKLKQESIIE